MNKIITQGFTIIELMIVVLIVAIIGSMAMSFYTGNVTKAKCTDGRSGLLNTVASLEKCKAIYGIYNNANCSVANEPSPKGHFNIAIASTATTFDLTATGTGGAASANNPYCPTITLDELGAQGGTGTDPW